MPRIQSLSLVLHRRQQEQDMLTAMIFKESCSCLHILSKNHWRFRTAAPAMARSATVQPAKVSEQHTRCCWCATLLNQNLTHKVHTYRKIPPNNISVCHFVFPLSTFIHRNSRQVLCATVAKLSALAKSWYRKQAAQRHPPATDTRPGVKQDIAGAAETIKDIE